MRTHALFVAAFVLLGILYFSTIRPGHDWGGDFAVYVTQSRNFAGGIPFTHSSYIPTAESLRHQPAVYPPLTSLILTPVYAAAGIDYTAFKIVLTFFLWLSLPVYYAFAIQRGLPPAVAAVIVVVFALSSHILEIRQMVGSDMVFLFISGVTLLFITAIYRRGWDERFPVRVAVATAAMLILCYLSRAAGLALIIGFALHEAWHARRIRIYGVLTLAIVGAAVVLYARTAFDPGQQYGRQFPFDPAAYVDHAIHYLRTPGALWGGAPALLRYLLAALTLGLAIAGFARRLRAPEISEAYVLVSAAVLIAYSTADTRYALPLLPLLLLYAAEGLVWAARGRRTVLAAIAAVTLFASACNVRAMETGPISEGVAKPSFASVCAFLRENTSADSLLLSWNPRVFGLYTGRRSALYPQTADPTEFDAQMLPASRYALIYHEDDFNRELLKPYLERAGGRWRLVFNTGDFRVYFRP